MDQRVLLNLFSESIISAGIQIIDPPASLFHYTSANGIRAIFENSGMFASPTCSSNDPSEVLYGWDVVNEVCDELFKRKENFKIVEKLLQMSKPGESHIKDFVSPLHLISFSEEPDNLSQWRSYADNGNGFSIEISTSSLISEPDHWLFYQCIYDREVQKEKVKKLINLCAKINDSQGSGAEFEKVFEMFLVFLQDLVEIFKHKAYVDEKEWRCKIVSIDPNQYITYVDGSHLKISFPVTLIGKSVIKNIVIGPKNNLQTTKLALRNLIDKSKFALKEKIEITPSEAPFR